MFLNDLDGGFDLPTLLTLTLFKNTFFTEHLQLLFWYTFALVQCALFSKIIVIVSYVYGHTNLLNNSETKITKVFLGPCRGSGVRAFSQNS